MEENNPPNNYINIFSRTNPNIPEKIAYIPPPLIVQLVQDKKKKKFPVWAQWIGLAATILFSIWGIVLTLSDKNQEEMICKLTILLEKQDKLINEMKKTNNEIKGTQDRIYELLLAANKQNQNFIEANKPNVRLRLKDKFISYPGNDSQGVSCGTQFLYYMENYGLLPAKNFVGKLVFLKQEGNSYESFLAFTTNIRNEFIDLDKGKAVEFGTNIINADCNMAGNLFKCIALFEYKYQSDFSKNLITDTIIYLNSVSTNEQYYYLTPIDSLTEKKVKKWYKKADINFYRSP